MIHVTAHKKLNIIKINLLHKKKLDVYGVRYLHQRKQYCGWHIDHSYQYRQTSVETGHSKHFSQGWDPS